MSEFDEFKKYIVTNKSFVQEAMIQGLEKSYATGMNSKKTNFKYPVARSNFETWNHQQKKIDEMKLTLDRSLDVLNSVDGHGDLTDLTNKIQELLK